MLPRRRAAPWSAVRPASGYHRRLSSEESPMEPLPKGANFVRAKFLWEIGLHIAGNPATP
jgi:hypothetical protein